MSALDKQVAGNHYKVLKMQPIQFISTVGYGFLQGNLIKYLVRDKNRKEDLEKAYHYIELMDELNPVQPHLKEILEQLQKPDKRSISASFFSQFVNGKRYMDIVFYANTGRRAKAKELLRKFINSGKYSEV